MLRSCLYPDLHVGPISCALFPVEPNITPTNVHVSHCNSGFAYMQRSCVFINLYYLIIKLQYGLTHQYIDSDQTGFTRDDVICQLERQTNSVQKREYNLWCPITSPGRLSRVLSSWKPELIPKEHCTPSRFASTVRRKKPVWRWLGCSDVIRTRRVYVTPKLCSINPSSV